MSAKEDIAHQAIWARELTADEIGRASRGLSERSYSKGGYICHRGDKLDYWTGVSDGLVKISAISRGGKAMTFAGATTEAGSAKDRCSRTSRGSMISSPSATHVWR